MKCRFAPRYRVTIQIRDGKTAYGIAMSEVQVRTKNKKRRDDGDGRVDDFGNGWGIKKTVTIVTTNTDAGQQLQHERQQSADKPDEQEDSTPAYLLPGFGVSSAPCCKGFTGLALFYQSGRKIWHLGHQC